MKVRNQIMLVVILLLSMAMLPAKNKKFGTTVCARQNFADTVRFEFEHGKIVIPVVVKGDTLRFWFDTGALFVMDSCVAARYSNKTITTRKISDVNGNIKNTLIMKIDEYILGNTPLRNNQCWLSDIHSSPILGCFGVDGFIGSDMLYGLIVKIDVQRKELIFTDKKDFFNDDKPQFSKFYTDIQNRPMLPVRVFGGKESVILFDTGDSDIISLSGKELSRVVADTSQIIERAQGVRTGGMHGFGQQSQMVMFRSDNMMLGGSSMKNVYGVSEGDITLMGTGFLKYGAMILDYQQHKFAFVPYQQRGAIQTERTIPESNMAFEDDKVYVSVVWENSESYKQGLRRGLQVLSMNGIATTELCRFILESKKTDARRVLMVKDEQGNKFEIVLTK